MIKFFAYLVNCLLGQSCLAKHDHVPSKWGSRYFSQCCDIKRSTKKNLIPTLFAIVSCFIVISMNSQAASVVAMDLKGLVAEADTIVVARCVSAESRWDDQRIVTDNILEITDSLTGDLQGQFVVTTMGGTAIHPRLKTEVKMSVSGSAAFRPGQESLLLTSTNSKGENQIIGLTQGKFDIESEPSSGRKVIAVGQKVLSNSEELSNSLDALFSPSIFEYETASIVIRKMSLEELTQKLEQALDRQKALDSTHP